MEEQEGVDYSARWRHGSLGSLRTAGVSVPYSCIPRANILALGSVPLVQCEDHHKEVSLEFISFIGLSPTTELSWFIKVRALLCRSLPHIPEVFIPEEPFLQTASAVALGLNQSLAVLRELACGRDLKKFLTVLSPPSIFRSLLDTLGSLARL